MEGKRYLVFNIHARSELVLAIKYAEFHGFQLTYEMARRADAYDGGRVGLSAWMFPPNDSQKYGMGLSTKGHHFPSNRKDCVVVETLQDFKDALDTFYHDGYLNEENFKV